MPGSGRPVMVRIPRGQRVWEAHYDGDEEETMRLLRDDCAIDDDDDEVVAGKRKAQSQTGRVATRRIKTEDISEEQDPTSYPAAATERPLDRPIKLEEGVTVKVEPNASDDDDDY